ncbi:MAG: T9SS type A sorting domain-containing protein, partial [Flavobacteriales bacterium]|nr:T9SS type A sorting domain-containing protein [Flavobacteriales bacterium]
FYHWYSNDASTKFTLAEVFLDSLGNLETGVSFLTTSINSLEKIEIDYINIFPIPTTYNVTITSQRNEEVVANLSDINGRELMNFVFVNSTELDLSNLEKGIYILHLNTKEGNISKKLIIE